MFYDEFESNIRSLSSLRIETSTQGTLIATLIMEKLHHEIKLIVTRNVEETQDMTKILEIANQELGTREACTLKTAEDDENGSDSYEGF